MTMARLSATLSDDQYAWVDEQADDLGVSKGKVLRECIDHIRADSSIFTGTVSRSAGAGEMEERLSELESRLFELESYLDVDSSDHSSATSTGDKGTTEPTDTVNKPAETDDSDRSKASSGAPIDLDSVAVSVVTNSDVGPPSDDSGTRTGRSERIDSSDNDRGHQSGTESTEQHEEMANTGPVLQGDGHPLDEAPEDSADDSSAESSVEVDRAGRIDENVDEVSTDEPSIVANRQHVSAYLESALDSDEVGSTVLECWSDLEGRGTMHTREFKQRFESVPLGYDSVEAWWTTEIRPVLDTLPGVEPPESGGNFYRFKYPKRETNG